MAPCQSAISAQIQADHGTQGHFTDHTTITRDMLGNARVQGSGGYLGTSFIFTCAERQPSHYAKSAHPFLHVHRSGTWPGGHERVRGRGSGIEYRLVKIPLSSVLRMRTLSELRGFMKMLIGTKSDRILGFHSVWNRGYRLTATIQTAMLGDLPFTVLRDAVLRTLPPRKGWESSLQA